MDGNTPGGGPAGAPAQETYRFAVEEEVRFRDLDALGHVNNAVYFTYFEHARVKYFQHLGLVDVQGQRPWFFILAEARCSYRSPAHLGDRLRIATAVTEIGRSSFRMGYLITGVADGRVVAAGETVQVAYDYGQGRPVPVPEYVRRRIGEWEGRPEWANGGAGYSQPDSTARR
ncbi:thioesterase family protein [Carboxydochorda subterranea]|uniref:Thioesterase family protein n=1 Tax=Carboxydichorda subterranea TaxID=3109565 RepID=A0ABZ1BUD8_9FIRM|nr:thioesterase family protein [Limnochorda sp. L945t]WRP16100.1 thioesterase family protein [Limnochorda sp. L945t]